jgi:hypothetical protein
LRNGRGGPANTRACSPRSRPLRSRRSADPQQFSICNNLGTLPFGARQVALPQFGAHASVGALVGAAPLRGASSGPALLRRAIARRGRSRIEHRGLSVARCASFTPMRTSIRAPP